MLGVFEGLVLVEELESTLIIHRVFSQEEGSSGDPFHCSWRGKNFLLRIRFFWLLLLHFLKIIG